jgi:hypothetical protein
LRRPTAPAPRGASGGPARTHFGPGDEVVVAARRSLQAVLEQVHLAPDPDALLVREHLDRALRELLVVCDHVELGVHVLQFLRRHFLERLALRQAVAKVLHLALDRLDHGRVSGGGREAADLVVGAAGRGRREGGCAREGARGDECNYSVFAKDYVPCKKVKKLVKGSTLAALKFRVECFRDVSASVRRVCLTYTIILHVRKLKKFSFSYPQPNL